MREIHKHADLIEAMQCSTCREFKEKGEAELTRGSPSKGVVPRLAEPSTELGIICKKCGERFLTRERKR